MGKLSQQWRFNLVHEESRSSKMFAVSQTISAKQNGMTKLWKHSEVDI
jgi:hypothetical protein